MTYLSAFFLLFLLNFPFMGRQTRNEQLIKAIAYELTALRRSLSLSQEDVYVETSIHIARIETGANNITISTLSYLLNFYEIPLSDFFTKVEKALTNTSYK